MRIRVSPAEPRVAEEDDFHSLLPLDQLLAHLLVPLLCGVLGAVGFDALAKQVGPVAAAVKGGGKLVGQAGQALWASVQAGQQVPAGNAGSGEVPARRRMPWEEDGDLQRQWEDEQKVN